MKGIGRSIHYWLINLEKVFLAMVGTVAVMSILMGAGDRMDFIEMLNLYLPMMGGIFAIAIMLSASTYYIPQSLSLGATRKETYIAMEITTHLLMVQTLLLAIIFNMILPQAIWSADYIVISAVCYLTFAGIGNAMCAGGLKLGNRAAMVIYMIMVVLVAGIAGAMGAMTGFEENSLTHIMMAIINFWFVALIFDILMAAVCYVVLRKHEVRA